VNRFALSAFVALAAATVAAFFFTQHLKVGAPLIAGLPRPDPEAINPLDPQTCGGKNHGGTWLSFFLLHRSDDVDVYVVDQNGAIVRTLATDRHMRVGVRIPDGLFYWNGREDNGRVAPDGQYYFHVALIHQGRTAVIATTTGAPLPVTVQTQPPRPLVTAVVPDVIGQGGDRVTIHYTGNEGRAPTIELYRTDLPGKPRLVASFSSRAVNHSEVWTGRIHGQLAPAGTYLVGLKVTDAACNVGTFPTQLPPAPGTAANAFLTVR